MHQLILQQCVLVPKLFEYMEKLDKCGGQQLDSWSCGCPSNNMNLITHANRQTLTDIGGLLAQYEDSADKETGSSFFSLKLMEGF